MNSNHNPRQNNRSGRQNNRNRNQNGRSQQKGSGRNQAQQQPLTATKQVDSHGPAGKLRGNVKQLYDQYNALYMENRTRDRTTSEAYGQYAHHYYTLFSDFTQVESAQQEEREKQKAHREKEVSHREKEISHKEKEAGENKPNIAQVDKDPSKDNPSENQSKTFKKSSVSKKGPQILSPELPLETITAATEEIKETKKISEKPKRKTAIKKPTKVKEVAE